MDRRRPVQSVICCIRFAPWNRLLHLEKLSMYGGGVRSCIVLLTVSANSNGQKVAGPSLPGKQGRAGAGGRAKHSAAWSGV